MAKLQCKISGCQEEHHAKGYCNRHYKKMTRLGSPLAGREHASGPRQRRSPVITDQTERQPEKRKAPGSGQGNYNFFLNQKFIEKLYNEADKARTEIIYKTANAHHVPHFLTMALLLSGFDRTNPEILDYLLDELKTWLGARDKIRFMECLANWEKRVHQFERMKEPRKVQQLSFFK